MFDEARRMSADEDRLRRAEPARLDPYLVLCGFK